MKRSSGVRVCAVAAAGALSLALVTGCSSGSDKKTDDTKASGSASAPAAPAAKKLTKDELQKLLLAQGDIKGYKVAADKEIVSLSKSKIKVDKPDCEPVAWATSALAPGDTDSDARNSVSQVPEGVDKGDIEAAFDFDVTIVGLSSYDGDGAEKAMKAVADGVKACAGGYGVAQDGDASKVSKVVDDKVPAQGDEAIGYTQSIGMDEGTADFHTLVVRKGNTIATFYTANVGALAGGKSAAVEIPAAVVQAQLAKLK
ncbi:hypothetical protein MTQ10_03705 [Streptomyces sp. XM83C]|jgi:hypothetical protein|uniref:hypothetical protein n=1 Tax=unclassified Streptomyces TaxID=2593676 RepID=UPI001FF75291|nr:hypothetical protein [Streptomyces sp. XM83C]MCK1818731.1 hypothetical protein [Streptomyces sp. XM83C]